jgi:hypothetical protein
MFNDVPGGNVTVSAVPIRAFFFLFDSDDVSYTLLRNVSGFLPNYMAENKEGRSLLFCLKLGI